MRVETELHMIQTLENSVGREKVVSLLAHHYENAQRAITELVQQQDNPDLNEIYGIAHRMHGSCGSLGFAQIALIFRKMGEAAQSANTANVREFIQAVHGEFSALFETVFAHYPEIKSGA